MGNGIASTAGRPGLPPGAAPPPVDHPPAPLPRCPRTRPGPRGMPGGPARAGPLARGPEPGLSGPSRPKPPPVPQPPAHPPVAPILPHKRDHAPPTPGGPRSQMLVEGGAGLYRVSRPRWAGRPADRMRGGSSDGTRGRWRRAGGTGHRRHGGRGALRFEQRPGPRPRHGGIGGRRGAEIAQGNPGSSACRLQVEAPPRSRHGQDLALPTMGSAGRAAPPRSAAEAPAGPVPARGSSRRPNGARHGARQVRAVGGQDDRGLGIQRFESLGRSPPASGAQRRAGSVPAAPSTTETQRPSSTRRAASASGAASAATMSPAVTARSRSPTPSSVSLRGAAGRAFLDQVQVAGVGAQHHRHAAAGAVGADLQPVAEQAAPHRGQPHVRAARPTARPASRPAPDPPAADSAERAASGTGIARARAAGRKVAPSSQSTRMSSAFSARIMPSSRRSRPA